MSEFLCEDELNRLDPAETHAFESPIPTQPISNGEFFPGHQSKEQKHVEALIKEHGDAMGKKLGMERRQFLRTCNKTLSPTEGPLNTSASMGRNPFAA